MNYAKLKKKRNEKLVVSYVQKIYKFILNLDAIILNKK